MKCPYCYHHLTAQEELLAGFKSNFPCTQCGRTSKTSAMRSLAVVALAIAAGKIAQHMFLSIFPGVLIPFLSAGIIVILIGSLGMKFIGKLLPI